MEALLIIPVILLFLFIVIAGVDRKPATTRPSIPERREPVEEEETLKNVSEPVISFVKFLKENPENFLVRKECRLAVRNLEYDTTYKLIDKANRKVYNYTIRESCLSVHDRLSTSSVSFLSSDERKYLLEAHKWGMGYIKNKLEEERNAKTAMEREEYKKIYCKEEDK